MLEHYDKNLTIADFADLSGRSLSTFNREFKLRHNKTPKQWLIEKKIFKAKELLDEGFSVEVGYHNVSHFIKAYKSIYGKTPKEMQKNWFWLNSGIFDSLGVVRATIQYLKIYFGI